MTVTVVAWNIERFGAFNTLKRGPDGKWVDCTLAAIACAVLSYGIDVLVIQEFRKPGAECLPTLCKMLQSASKDTWSFDYVKGAFNVANGKLVKGPDNTEYTGRGNSEGYAVVWRNDVLAPVTGTKMSIGLNGNSSKKGYINLALPGATPAYYPFKTIKIVADGKGFGSDSRFPMPGTPDIVNNDETNKTVLVFQSVRRPCIVNVISSDNGTVPVLVYHIPVNQKSASYGTWAFPLVQEIGADTSRGVVVAGDFNLTSENQFEAMTSLYGGLNLDIGTPSRNGEFGFARSQIQFQAQFESPARLVDKDSIYEHPRDVLFYRKTMRVARGGTGVINVVSDLQNVSSAFTKAVLATSPIPETVNKVIDSMDDNYALPELVRNDATLLKTFSAPFQASAKAFGSALAAAVFYRCFISDHLPVYCQL